MLGEVGVDIVYDDESVSIKEERDMLLRFGGAMLQLVNSISFESFDEVMLLSYIWHYLVFNKTVEEVITMLKTKLNSNRRLSKLSVLRVKQVIAQGIHTNTIPRRPLYDPTQTQTILKHKRIFQ